MNQTGNYIWVNHYDRNGNMVGSTPYETMEAAMVVVYNFLNLMSLANRPYKDFGDNVWADKDGRFIAAEDFGDWELHFYHTAVGVLANYSAFESISHDALSLIVKKAYKDLNGDVDGLSDYIDKLVTSGQYKCYVGLAKNN